MDMGNVILFNGSLVANGSVGSLSGSFLKDCLLLKLVVYAAEYSNTCYSIVIRNEIGSSLLAKNLGTVKDV